MNTAESAIGTMAKSTDLLRVLMCGSVDDGKSTLLGRLLMESELLEQDVLEALKRDSVTHGTTNGELDPALVTDGLKAEREQGITIDVAYRYFSTEKREFIVADAPGHEQYTRNMVTGASTADLAVILVDARHGVREQTRRHSFIASLLGIKHMLIAVNKMDLVDFKEETFEAIKDDFEVFAGRLDIRDVQFVPIAALPGDNVVELSARMPWYKGSTFLHFLESVHIASDQNLVDLRLPVQYVHRPDASYRGYSGTLASGVLRPGDEILVLPSRKKSVVKSVDTFDGPLNEAFPPLAITITLEDELDISRGDMIVHPGNVPAVEQTVEAMVVWMGEEPLKSGKQYRIKHTSKEVSGTVTGVRYEVDVNSLHRKDAESLILNSIGRCAFELTAPLAFDSYTRNRATGSFIIIDRLTNNTVGAGMILDQKSEKTGDYWNGEEVESEYMEQEVPRGNQLAASILLTGLAGAGKTTLARALEERLATSNHRAVVLDGGELRKGLNKDLIFDAAGRSENVRRCFEVAKVINQSGQLCICALEAPNADVRAKAKKLIGKENVLHVHLSVSLDVCRERDTSGIYEASDRGDLDDVPGLSVPYEEPMDADLLLKTGEIGVEECVEEVMKLLNSKRLMA